MGSREVFTNQDDISESYQDDALSGNWLLFLCLGLRQTVSVWVECCRFAFEDHPQVHLSEVDLESSIRCRKKPNALTPKHLSDEHLSISPADRAIFAHGRTR